jgi:hypothetical protein
MSHLKHHYLLMVVDCPSRDSSKWYRPPLGQERSLSSPEVQQYRLQVENHGIIKSVTMQSLNLS